MGPKERFNDLGAFKIQKFQKFILKLLSIFQTFRGGAPLRAETGSMSNRDGSKLKKMVFQHVTGKFRLCSTFVLVSGSSIKLLCGFLSLLESSYWPMLFFDTVVEFERKTVIFFSDNIVPILKREMRN